MKVQPEITTEKPQFVYVTHIKTTREKLWQALTSAEFTRQYWGGMSVEVGAQQGDPFVIKDENGETKHDDVVLVHQAPHRLSFTFNPIGFGEPPSRVTYELESRGETVRLTVTHEDFPAESKVFPSIQCGWPCIVNSLKTLLETGSALKTGFEAMPDAPPQREGWEPTIYVQYIKTTAEKAWRALTDPEFTQQYFFGRTIESDWKVGSPVRYWKPDGELDVSGEILECDPPRFLSFTWMVEWVEEFRQLPPCRVSFLIEPIGEVVRLTLTEIHDAPIDPKYLEGGRNGWPMIMCGLKSLLETGHPLPLPVPSPPA